jgi:hypothetical protein
MVYVKIEELCQNEFSWSDNLQMVLETWLYDEMKMKWWLLGVWYVDYHDVVLCVAIIVDDVYDDDSFDDHDLLIVWM